MRNFQLVLNSGVKADDAKSALVAGFRKLRGDAGRGVTGDYLVKVEPATLMGSTDDKFDVRIWRARLESVATGLVVAVAFMDTGDL